MNSRDWLIFAFGVWCGYMVALAIYVSLGFIWEWIQ